MVINDATPSHVDDTSTLLDLAESIIVEHALHQSSSLCSLHNTVKLCIELFLIQTCLLEFQKHHPYTAYSEFRNAWGHENAIHTLGTCFRSSPHQQHTGSTSTKAHPWGQSMCNVTPCRWMPHGRMQAHGKQLSQVCAKKELLFMESLLSCFLLHNI